MSRGTLRSMLLFHCSSGARLSIRAALPVLAALVVAAGMQEFPGAAIARVARALATHNTDTMVRVAAAALCLLAASWAAPRITHGVGGWLRHLPVDGLPHRRAALGALVVAQAPLLLTWILLIGVAAAAHEDLDEARIAGLPLVALGAAWASLPARRGVLTGLLGGGAVLCGIAGSWWLLLMGLAALALLELSAGEIIAGSSTGWAAPAPSVRRPAAHLTWLRISARAVGWKSLGATLYALLPLGACAMFLYNNELTEITAVRGARLGGIVALTMAIGGLSELLAVHRPPWPWARSLPWPAAHRITRDALYLSLHALPLLALLTLLSWRGALASAAALPALCLRAAGLMRHVGESRTGAAGRLMAEGIVAAGLSCLLGWVPWLLLLLSPLLLRHAILQEKRQKVTRWDELHHLSAGDPLSWSAS